MRRRRRAWRLSQEKARRRASKRGPSPAGSARGAIGSFAAVFTGSLAAGFTCWAIDMASIVSMGQTSAHRTRSHGDKWLGRHSARPTWLWSTNGDHPGSAKFTSTLHAPFGAQALYAAARNAPRLGYLPDALILHYVVPSPISLTSLYSPMRTHRPKTSSNGGVGGVRPLKE